MSKKLKKKLKVGLALGGGGARGFAHLGVIKCFEENGITFDYVAGTSVGSLVGAFYAYGYSSGEMIEIASKFQAKDIKRNKIFFVPDKTDGLETIIKNNVGTKNIEDLKTPLSVVAVDMKKGEEVDITKGELAKAVAGSCAVPSVFSTVEFEGMHLNDGGLTNTIPSDICRKHGCDIVIAVDVNPTRGYGTDSLKLLDILAASIRIMMKVNAIKGEIYSDCIIAPNLKKFSSASMDGYEEMIEIGYQTAKLKIDEIKALIYPDDPLTFFGKIKLLFTRNKKKKEKQIKNYEKNHIKK